MNLLKANKAKKYICGVFGCNLSSILTSALISLYGGTLVLFEKQSHLLNKLQDLSINDHKNNLWHYKNNFYGFSANYFFYYVLKNELNIYDNIEWIKPSIKLTIFNNNYSYHFLNNEKIIFSNLINKYFPLEKNNILKFQNDIIKANNNFLFFRKLSNKYPSAYELLKHYFLPNTELFKFFAQFSFWNSLPLDKMDSGYFLNNLILNVVTNLIYPKNGINSVLRELLKIIANSDSDLYTNTTVKYGVFTNDLATSFLVKNKKEKQKILINKYIIGANLPSFINDVMFKKNNKFINKYNNLIIKSLGGDCLITFHLTLSKKYFKNSKFKSFQYLFNELSNNFDYKNDNILKMQINNCPFWVINYHAINSNEKTNFSVNINFFDSIKKWEKFSNLNSKKQTIKIENYLNKIKKIIFKRIDKKFPLFIKNIIHSYVSHPFNNSNNNNLQTISIHGFEQNLQHKLVDSTSFTAFSNCYLSSKYGKPGGSYLNAFQNAYNCYYLFDYNKKILSKHDIEIIKVTDILHILQKKFIKSERYNNKKIGIHFDNDKIFTLHFNNSQLSIIQSTFNEAFSCDIYMFITLSNFKKLMQKKINLPIAVILNKIRIRGGVFLFQRMFRNAHLWPITIKDIKKYSIENMQFSFPKSKLLIDQENKNLKKTKKIIN